MHQPLRKSSTGGKLPVDFFCTERVRSISAFDQGVGSSTRKGLCTLWVRKVSVSVVVRCGTRLVFIKDWWGFFRVTLSDELSGACRLKESFQYSQVSKIGTTG